MRQARRGSPLSALNQETQSEEENEVAVELQLQDPDVAGGAPAWTQVSRHSRGAGALIAGAVRWAQTAKTMGTQSHSAVRHGRKAWKEVKSCEQWNTTGKMYKLCC